jgi:hypothetical protein
VNTLREYLHSQKRHRLNASCEFDRPDASCPQVASSPSDLLQLDICRLAHAAKVDETTCVKPVCSSQLAASLLPTCNKLVIIKPEQAMRTLPDIGLVIADLLCEHILISA